MDVESLDRNTNKDNLGTLCHLLAPALQVDFGLDKPCLLMALAGVETDFATNNRPKFEPAYAIGGTYFKDPTLQKLALRYGPLASMSYGPWQLLAIKAAELGFLGHPLLLWDGEISGPLVVSLINKIAQGATSMDQVCDAYNTGSFRMGAPPKEYIQKFWARYETVIRRKIPL